MSKMAMFTPVILLALTQLLTSVATGHVIYDGKTLEGGEVCPGGQQTRTVLDEIDTELGGIARDTILPSVVPVGSRQSRPANSCSEISEVHQGQPSGLYWVRSHNGTAVQVFCDMGIVCGCNSTGGWTRVANLNMRDQSQQCPGAWILKTYSTEPRRLCWRDSSAGGCLSAMYSTYGISYRHVCGRVTGYQYRSTDGFGQHNGLQTIEGPYLDGVSLTHGPSGTRKHIWSFAAGNTEIDHHLYNCPCADGRAAPSFVGNDYFCESGNPGSTLSDILQASDPLWDGQGCASPPCCELSSPPGVTAPWFCKQLPQAKTDDIEFRICGDEGTSNEDTLVQLVELYIQ